VQRDHLRRARAEFHGIAVAGRGAAAMGRAISGRVSQPKAERIKNKYEDKDIWRNSCSNYAIDKPKQ